MKKKLLIFTDWYLPAFKAGGPVKSVSNLVNLLGDDLDIYIITSDKDKTDTKDSLPVQTNQWVDSVKARIFYINSINYLNKLIKIIKEVQPNEIYINSIFSIRYALIPLLLVRFKVIKIQKIILAPRGMLHDGALALKSRKKRLFLAIANRIRLFKRVYFHVTDEVERKDVIRKLHIKSTDVTVIPNIPSLDKEINNVVKKEVLKVVFLARLSEKKNLEFALQILAKCKFSCLIIFDLYGPIEEDYYSKLKPLINQQPKHVNVSYKGELNFSQTSKVLQQYHLYFLPTLGENFGHSIFEAFAAGLPVIISDQTPWRDLEAQKVGFDIPLTQSEHFIRAIEFFAECSEEEWREWSHNAREYSENFFSKQNFEKAYSKLFKNKVKIGLVAPITITRYKGGISVFAEHFLKHKAEFKKHNIEIQFLNTCKVPRTNASIGKFRFVNFKNYVKFFCETIMEIRQDGIKLLHYNTSVGLSLLKDVIIANLLEMLTKTKVILHIHSTDIEELQKINFNRKVLIFLLKNIYCVVVLSDKLRQDLINLGLENKKLVVIWNYSMLNFKQELSTKRVKRNILFIGSVDIKKGVLDLLNAINYLPESLDWHLHVAGDFVSDDFKLLFFSKLEEFNLKKKVTLHGYVSDKAKIKLFEMSSILVLPSYSEGMPLSILEGISAGCAIVATNVGANKETIKSVTNLIQPGDVKALKNEIEKLLTDTQYLDIRQKQSMELSKEFSFEKFVDQIIPLYMGSTK